MIRAIRESDIEAAVELRREALRDTPLAFAASPETDFGSDPASVRARIGEAPDSVILGAFDGERLVGIASVFREKSPKSKHRANLFGMYVTPSHRRRGFASQLVAAAVRHAESLPGVAWLQLSVSSSAPGARRIYEEAGFTAWGHQPDTLRHEGESASELHLALELSPDAGDEG